ncbi:MAG: prolipoprotein diacylglyceryl transferase [Cellulomonas sp.]|uniref:prolipoprotein diacylglyceryl transferase n=1 Tax=Cellulomonas sp. 73-92 TaxID=1895740 RepID=UPI000929805B|nr:prolipoprotein diacylglyceryl transferase [Cellulomonas sp. 73-92]MBN9375496.1 prolipoprotein diacylglyceryl transferase [Cellulomonas sp.]OJV75974.1 MAG: diacylglyceryl transferase [Cellulomonas sp. 73-92]
MRPVLFSIFGFDVQSYGVSKAAAALLAAWLLGRAFQRRGLKTDDAYSLVMWATIWGFVGAKIYFLLEHTDEISLHHLGGSGFTWYGGLIGGIATFLIIIRRRQLPAAFVIDAAAIPLTLAYGVGRIGCWLSGDGTYGKPTTLPWGQAFPNGMVATDVRVHPTPLYEVFAAMLIAAILWGLQRRTRPPLEMLGAYLILSGLSRFLVEFLRINTPALFGLTQPQLWALASILAGTAIIAHGRLYARHDKPTTSPGHAPTASTFTEA